MAGYLAVINTACHGHPADPAATVFLRLLLQNHTDKSENVKTFFSEQENNSLSFLFWFCFSYFF